MQYEAVVYEPGQEGKVMMVNQEDFSKILGGSYEYAPNKHGLSYTEVVVNQDGIGLNLPYNRGYFGTFIVVKQYEDDSVETLSFTAEEIAEIKKVLDKKPNFNSFNSRYLATFFEEKELETVVFQYSKGTQFMTLTNYDVIFSLLNSDEKEMLVQAEDIVRKIDFVNGDINNFLEHMGSALAESTFAQYDGFFG